MATRRASAYTKELVKKWVFLVAAALDVAGLVAQVLLPGFRPPAWVYTAIIVMGFWWAGYQVHRDTLALLPSLPPEPSPFDVLPIRFNIGLNREIPEIHVWLYVVNHQTRKLRLKSLDIQQFSLDAGPTIEHIQLSRDLVIGRKQTDDALCSRALLETEAKAISKREWRNPVHAPFTASSRGLAGRKELHHEAAHFDILGWVESRPM